MATTKRPAHPMRRASDRRRAERNTLHWIIVHEVAVRLVDTLDGARPGTSLRRLLVTVSARACERYVDAMLHAEPYRRHHP